MSRTAVLWDEWADEDTLDSLIAGGSSPTSVTFPTTALDARVYIALGADLSQPPTSWQWEDITRFVRFATGVSVTNWRRDETSRVGPGAGQLVLDNRDGRFCRRNPSSPYYGMLSKNTPIWGTINAGSGVKTRLQHFVNEWPTRWDKSASDCTVQIKTAGILRRLSQGSAAGSPLRRTAIGSSPLAYWPLEDGADAVSAAAATANTSSLVPQAGTVVFASETTAPVGTQPLPDLSAGGELAGTIGATFPSANHTVSFIFSTASTPCTPIRWEIGSGTYNRARIDVSTTQTNVQLIGTGIFTTILTGTTALVDSAYHYVRVVLTQSGADIAGELWVDGVRVDAFTATSATLGAPTAVRLNPQGQQGGAGNIIGIGHVAFFGGTAADGFEGLDGYDGELVHNRIARVCAEEGIPFTAASASTVAMGPQPVAKAVDILRECETADLGSLFEVDWGLGFQSTMDRYNASVAMTLDFNQGQIAESPEPADDDQRTRNKVTASRSGGSEYTHEVTTGPMGTGSSGPGLYDDSVTVNVQTDAQLLPQASWRTLLGTVDVDRWPSIDMNLTAAPELIDTWTALGFGARINAINPPSQVAPETIDAFVEGYTERWDTRSWVASLNTSPASPYRVFRLAGPDDDTSSNLGYLVPTTCVLAEDLDTTETGVDITTTPLWSTTAADWTPGALITCDGEDMTVTAVSGAGNPQTLTVTRSSNGVVKAHSTGATVAFKYGGFLAL